MNSKERHMRGGPIVKCIEEVPEEEMTRIRYKDGLIASIWERWIELSPRYIAFHNRWDPGAMSPYHGHHGDHINLILQGEIRHGDIVARAGDHIWWSTATCSGRGWRARGLHLVRLRGR